jgi:hypothetical protein
MANMKLSNLAEEEREPRETDEGHKTVEAGGRQEPLQRGCQSSPGRGPQQVQRRGDAVVILAQRDYEKLTGRRPGFREFLLSAPSLTGLNLERDRSPMRDVKL